jgi:hypothetical protein
MKQQFRIKLIAAAVAVMASASAQAVVVTSSNSGATSYSELILVAYDDTKVLSAPITYVRGLGVQMDAFLPNSPLVTSPAVTVNAGAATVFAGGARTPSTGAIFSNAPVAGDTNWAAFTTAVGDLDNIRWGVVGRKAGTASVAGQYPAAVYTGAAAPTNNAQVQTLSSAFNLLMETANGQGCGGVNDSCVTEFGVGSNLGANVTFNGVAPLSETLSFTLAFKNASNNSQAGAPAFVPFCNAVGNCATWSINGSNGEVTYSLAALQQPEPPVSQIPVPAAGWLLLTGIAGLVGFSRRKRNAA